MEDYNIQQDYFEDIRADIQADNDRDFEERKD